MSGDRTRILMIDDDVDLTTMVRGTLGAEGYDVLCANDGESGLELAFTEHPHLVLLDVVMPGMDGYAVCRELQFGYTKDIPVIFLTGQNQLSNMMEASRSGASAYVTKPFRVEQLLRTVADVLRDASVYYDEITGLPTLAQAQVQMQRMIFGHGQLGILCVTLDNTHALEQLQGFETVDDIFRVIGNRLEESRGTLFRGQDLISISSLGNGFLLVLSPSRSDHFVTHTELRDVKRRLEQSLLAGLEEELAADLAASVDLYVGYARLSHTPKVRFRRALFEAIEQAMHGVRLQRDQAHHRLRNEFDRIIAERLVSCVYQPIVSLDNYSVLGYELLARGPDKSELHRPDALFDLARREGKVAELDHLCRLMAARSCDALPVDTLRFINVEPDNLCLQTDNDVLLEDIITATAPEARRLTVMELTENSVIDDFTKMRDVIARLRKEGFRIAVDDAGAGYSGLQTMVELEPDFIKLDISLTRNLETSRIKRKLVAMLRDFCRDAGVTLIAEGIETQPQLDTLVDLGVAFGQGFLFAHPSSPYPLATAPELVAS